VVGIVIVSHSAALAEGVVELAREMGGGEVAIEPAGGLEEPGQLGTDAERVRGAIERARSEHGVLVLMDLGSALMSAEMAAEMLEGEDGGPILLCEAPLVEGAMAAVARARGGATLDEVAAEARAALQMKASQLGVDEAEPGPPAPAGDGPELRLRVDNRLGLHARPAARFAGTAGRFDADVTVTNTTRGRGPADGRSLTALATLGVRQGDEILVCASGAQANEALAALRELAAANFGDEDGGVPRGAGAAAPAPAASAARGAPPAPPVPGARLVGVPAAEGIAIGAARPLGARALVVEEGPAEAPEAGWRRLEEALAAAHHDIERDRAAVAERASESEAAIFDAHLALLDDAALLDPARRAVFEAGRGAAQAWRAAAEGAAEAFRALDDPYLRGRAVDVEDVAERVLRHLVGEAAEAGPREPGIVVASELTPGQAAGLDRALVRGVATALGGATSHAAILARALGIPAVVGLGDELLAVAEGTPLVLDGDAGTVEVDPGAAAIAEHEARRAAAEERRRSARARAHEPARTRDGRRIEVFANVGGPADVAPALAQGAEGVGLLRTEFLFLDRRTPPDEEEQLAAYREIGAALGARPLVLRTLDAGADKPLAFLQQAPEANPFLGRRGLRLSLAEPELLRTQLRAVLRAAAEYPVKVMFPMVSTTAELRAARALLEQARADVGGPDDLEVGVMIEVPAAALAAERFAREVDFFSIGTNDLTQYTMAAERGNAELAGLVAGPVPAVLRLVREVTVAAQAQGRWVGVCGELAGEPAAAIVLAGLGVSELSMAGGRIPEVKEALRGIDLATARRLAERALQLESADDVRALVAEAAGSIRPPGGGPGR
jgi:phosphoenolpyruvate-protein phosphotransferase/dihydroxyacetone kinase phosphotransfer subunit